MNETTPTDENSGQTDLAPGTEQTHAPAHGASETPESIAEVETAERAAAEPKSPPFEPSPTDKPLEFAQYAGPPKPFGAILAGGIAGALVSAGLLWYFLPESNLPPEIAQRLTTLESNTAASSAAAEKRLGALEAGAALQADKMAGVSAFGPRLSALEAAAPEVKAAAETSKSALSEAQAARADAAKALQSGGATQDAGAAAPAAPSTDASALETRLGKLETSIAGLSAAQPNLAPINDRLANLETALATPKSEARVAPEPAPPGREDAAPLAVVAQALEARIAAGQPYPLEQAALERLGADPARLAQLKPFAKDGAPSLAALTGDFAKIAPALLSAAEPRSDDGVMARLMTNMSKIVRVHPVGEQAGDDPAAVISQIGAALGRGDAGGALAAFDRLPEPARQAGKDWAAKAQGRVAAATAAQALLDDSITRLGAAKN